MSWKEKAGVVTAFIVVASIVGVLANEAIRFVEEEGTIEVENILHQDDVTDQEKRIREIIESESFQTQIREEAERQYFLEVKQEAEQRLLELEEGGFEGEKVTALREYLKATNPSLSQYAYEIVQLPRWMEVVGIIGTETTFCTAGVGASRNNCGAIKNRNGEFKTYLTRMDSIEDVAILLEQPRYKDKSIATMNGTYCYDPSRSGNKCEGWTERINKIVSDILAHMG